MMKSLQFVFEVTPSVQSRTVGVAVVSSDSKFFSFFSTDGYVPEATAGATRAGARPGGCKEGRRKGGRKTLQILRFSGASGTTTSWLRLSLEEHHITIYDHGFEKRKLELSLEIHLSLSAVFSQLCSRLFSQKKRVAINRLPFFHGVSEPQLGSGRQSHQHLGCRVSSRFAGGICWRKSVESSNHPWRSLKFFFDFLFFYLIFKF